ncbi:MAG: N-6 DNA methylase, partial [Treponemataceae bacterium]|nr:N-6 DNA methylase [Treponemataceae bacterium]
EVGKYTDFSFLSNEHFDEFIETVYNLKLSQEDLERRKEIKEAEIDKSLVKLNNDIYQNEKGLSENDRVYLVAASIIATLGIPGKVEPLEKDELKSRDEEGNTDGEIILRKVKAYLNGKDLPNDKRDLIIRTLQNTLTAYNINKVVEGETQIKRVFSKIVDDLGSYYKIGLTTDFTGKLFNEMYSWLGFTQDKLNDVVLTPSYVATLLVKLAHVKKDSYVWDFTTGSAGLLVAAMNEMLIDAKNKISSPEKLREKEIEIKATQLLGLEVLPSIYMLAILNMILMGDGSSNIINKDSLNDFDGHYGFGKTDQKFPADAFVLNPPYSEKGNGMNFVEKALNMMDKGYAAIIIQNSAGSGKATEYNKRILEKHTLLASIKMPIDLFVGKSSVQTNIYVFKIAEPHEAENVVKFIDFSNDGYTRTNRKKASNNLKDTDHAKERYQEIVDLVKFGKKKLNYFTEKEYYEGTIDPNNGNDWNQTAPIDTKPTLEDFKKTVADYLAWEVSNLLKNQGNDSLGK